MKDDLTKIYEGADLSGGVADVLYLPIVRAATLENVSVRTDEPRTNLVQTENAIFSVKRAGVEITTVTILSGSKVGAASGLSVALADGDEITLDLVSGSVSSPITLNLGVDDGQAGGGGTTLPAGDLNALTNKIEKVQGKTVNFPILQEGLSDEFDGLNPAKFTVVAGSAQVIDGSLRLSTTSGATDTLLKSVQSFNFDNSEIIIEFDNYNAVDELMFGVAKNSDLSNPDYIYSARKYIGIFMNNNYVHTYGRFYYGGQEDFFADTYSGSTANRRFRLRTAAGILYYDVATPTDEWVNKGVYDYSAASLADLRFFILLHRSGSSSIDVKYLHSNIGQPPMMLWTLNPDNTIAAITLADLKAALNALP